MRTRKMRALLGDGTGFIDLDVTYFAEFPRGVDHTCAFCHGDACAEDGVGEIAEYFNRNKWAETCPICNGRPT